MGLESLSVGRDQADGVDAPRQLEQVVQSTFSPPAPGETAAIQSHSAGIERLLSRTAPGPEVECNSGAAGGESVEETRAGPRLHRDPALHFRKAPPAKRGRLGASLDEWGERRRYVTKIGLAGPALPLYRESTEAERLQGLVLRPRLCPHQDDEALGQAARAHPVVRGVGALDRTGPRTELKVAPSADVHPNHPLSKAPPGSGRAMGPSLGKWGERRRRVTKIGLHGSALPLYRESSDAERLQGLVLRPWWCTHQGEEVLVQAARAHPVVRGVGAPDRTGPRTELNVAPGADVHPILFHYRKPLLGCGGDFHK